MTNVSQSSTVQSTVLPRADQPTTESDKFGAALRQAKASGRPADGEAQGSLPEATKQAMVERRLSPKDFVKSIESTTNGANVAKTLTAASNDGEINQVLSDLSPAELNTVAKELNESGLSQNEVNTLCNSIVSDGANPKNLAKLTEAFINNPPAQWMIPPQVGGPIVPPSHPPPLPPPPADLAATLESSIANRSSIATRVDYIQALRPEIETQAGVASAVGSVLTSLTGNPQGVDQAFRIFSNSPRELNDVLTAANGVGFADIVNAAATKGTGADTQAMVFQAATKAFTEIDSHFGLPTWVPLDPPDPPDIFGQNCLSALTNLIQSNPEGILESLNSSDSKQIAGQYSFGPPVVPGQALTAYAGAMLAHGDTKPLANLFQQLKSKMDNNNIDDPPNYQAATLLGYFVGAVDQAIADNNVSIATLSSLLGDIGSSVGPVGGVVEFIIQQFGQGQQSAVSQTLKELALSGASQGAQTAFGNELQKWPGTVTSE